MPRKKHNYDNLPNVFEQTIQDKTEEFERARSAIQEKLDMLDGSHYGYDNGLSDIEDRAERNYLNEQLRQLEAEYKKEIEALQTR